MLILSVQCLDLLLQFKARLAHSHSKLLFELSHQHRLLLILIVQQLQLIVNQTVFGALLLSQRPLLLQFWRPEGFNAVHGAAELLIRQLQLLLKVAEFPLQVAILVLEIA